VHEDERPGDYYIEDKHLKCLDCGKTEIKSYWACDVFLDKGLFTCFCGGRLEVFFPGIVDEHNLFKPFYSDTFDMPVRDRMDLKKIKELRKEHKLECVGHRQTKPDRKAIRNNYENDELTISALKKGL